ncbi:PEPxxWA-CTERM sorting domain-containing protein [Altererythrobacter sp. HHU K3-1]|uniref:PEPxxWA-CTERM sorting domain-containing protein n=2 Tax=Qipengyuania atrilutea TaxID=2744473 RepID=A0A850HAT5_9SPHN|nr:PEPxxWA-CTERM sorting domain-containing protein [Actirhodobacter atriluteus]
MSVIGTTNQTNTTVNFTSNEMLTVAASQGQARIEGVDGSLDNLTVTLADAMLSFTEFEFNLFDSLDNTTSVTITLSDGTMQTFDLSRNGQNFFGIRATDGDTLTSVSFATNGTGVGDVRQVRIGGISEMTAAVPEPATWALLLLGFGFVGGMMRKTKPAHVRVRYA